MLSTSIQYPVERVAAGDVAGRDSAVVVRLPVPATAERNEAVVGLHRCHFSAGGSHLTTKVHLGANRFIRSQAPSSAAEAALVTPRHKRPVPANGTHDLALFNYTLFIVVERTASSDETVEARGVVHGLRHVSISLASDRVLGGE